MHVAVSPGIETVYLGRRQGCLVDWSILEVESSCIRRRRFACHRGLVNFNFCVLSTGDCVESGRMKPGNRELALIQPSDEKVERVRTLLCQADGLLICLFELAVQSAVEVFGLCGEEGLMDRVALLVRSNKDRHDGLSHESIYVSSALFTSRGVDRLTVRDLESQAWPWFVVDLATLCFVCSGVANASSSVYIESSIHRRTEEQSDHDSGCLPRLPSLI